MEPGVGTLGEVLSQAVEGAALQLESGVYEGSVVIDKPLTIRGVEGAVIQGDGEGTVITIDAPDVTISGVTITGSGSVAGNDGRRCADDHRGRSRTSSKTVAFSAI